LIDAGTVLAGRYRLEQRIGSGGMGDVWRAFDRVLGRTVAVKCLRDAPPDEPAFVDRFRAEARTMATISHPGVVEVYDFGDDPTAGVYLIMKYIDGESLAHTLARDGRLTPEATMRLVAETAEALHAAHEKGVTHRDVKPGNLLLRPDGHAVLTDFGIARSAGVTRHTSTGSLLGTAGYIAPEQATGQPATARSDIYSLGVVAYRCLTGHLPFTGDSVVELALRHAHDEPPPLPADVPPSVRAIVERAMAKDPAARWASAAVLAAQARRAVAPAPIQRSLAAPAQRQTTAPAQRDPTAATQRQSTAPTQRQSTAPTQRQTALAPAPTRRPPVSGGRALLIAGAAALVIGIIATVAIVRGGDLQAQGPGGDPGATSPVANAGTRSPSASGAASPTADPSATSATADPGATNSTAGAGSAALAVPTNVTATPIGPNTIRLQWTDNSTGEDGFTIHNGVTARDVGADTTTYDWTGLAAATYSCFKVRAYNSSGVSSYYPTSESDWVCTTSLPGTGPAAPTNLTATPVSPSTIRLQWMDNSTDEEGFTLYNGATSRNVGAGTTTYEWDGLAAGTYMCFKVRSYRWTGVSAYVPADPDWSCTTTPT